MPPPGNESDEAQTKASVDVPSFDLIDNGALVEDSGIGQVFHSSGFSQSEQGSVSSISRNTNFSPTSSGAVRVYVLSQMHISQSI
jgi:hypothetical protein